MPNICLVVEYVGTNFSGWQKQPPGVRTIQEELQRVIEMVLRRPIEPLHAAGRTDSGVHAKRQVVTFFTDPVPDLMHLTHSVSCILRGELAIRQAVVVPDQFNPRDHALRKRYIYTIINREAPPALDLNRAWHIRGSLDIERMQREAKSLEGVHDFSSLRAHDCTSRNPVKEIFSSEIVIEPPYIRYDVTGRGFLKQMVRNIVGTLVYQGQGKIKESMLEILQYKDRRRAGVTAAACGLCMERIWYPREMIPEELWGEMT